MLSLDTKHISHLARFPHDPDSEAVLSILRQSELVLGLSMIHLYELSDPRFKSRGEVGALLDSISVWWAKQIPDLFTAEIRAGMSRALGNETWASAFVPKFGDAFNVAQRLVERTSKILDLLASDTELRASVGSAPTVGFELDRLKGNAVLRKRPMEPLAGMIRDRNIVETPAGLIMPVPYSAETLIERAGGLPGFPAYQTFHALTSLRLGDDRFRPTVNDLFDEWHAWYAPYTAAITLDRATAARLRDTHLPVCRRATNRLREVPGILARNFSGPRTDDSWD